MPLYSQTPGNWIQPPPNPSTGNSRRGKIAQLPARNGMFFDNLGDLNEILTADQVAARLQVSPHTIAKWRIKHGFPSFKMGPKHVRFVWGRVVEWLQT